MSVESAYRVLDLEPGASLDHVKAAYRRLALKWYVSLTPFAQIFVLRNFHSVSLCVLSETSNIYRYS